MANLCLNLFVRPSFALGVDVQQQCLGTWRPRLPIAFRCPRLRLAVTSCIHPAAPPNLLPRQKTCTRTVSRKYLHLHCERCLSACLSVDEDRFRSAFAVPFLHNDGTIKSQEGTSHSYRQVGRFDSSPYPTRTPLIRVYLTL